MRKMSLLQKILVVLFLSIVSMIGVVIQDNIEETTKDVAMGGGEVVAGVETVIDLNSFGLDDGEIIIEELDISTEGSGLVDMMDGYINDAISVYKEPGYQSEIVGKLFFNDAVSYYQTNDEWAAISYEEEECYIPICFIDDTAMEGIVYSIPDYAGVKTWMSYTAISKKSRQGALQEIAVTDDFGFRRIDDRYLIAVGSRFGAEIGQYLDLILEDGTVVKCIKGDAKADIHTDDTNTFTTVNGSWCCSEFIMDSSAYIGPGDISSYVVEFKAPVDKIIVYEKYVTKD